jgi:hypothetical protein
MKQLAFVLLIFALGCGGNYSEEDNKTLAYYDSLTTVLKHNQDSIPTIDISGNEEVQYEPENRTLTVGLPKLNEQFPAVVDIHVEFRGDSIKSYRITAGKSTPEPKHKDYGKIQAGDTKSKIAVRLNIKPAQIKNKEPLRVGEEIIIGYD